jgi:hypothetical protein
MLLGFEGFLFFLNDYLFFITLALSGHNNYYLDMFSSANPICYGLDTIAGV